MIRILLVDPESLLAPAGGAHPDARRSLVALSRLMTSEGAPLFLAAAACGRTLTKAAELVASLGLSDLLAPEFGVSLPLGGDRAARSALAAAVHALPPRAHLGACAAVLRDEERVLSCRWLGIPALAPGFDEMQWRDVPLLVARLMDPTDLRNLGVALEPYVPEGVEQVSVVEAESKRLTARAKRWSPLPATSTGLPDGIHVLLPVDISVQIESKGARIESVSVGHPSPAEVNEAARAAEALFARAEVALESGVIGPTTKHFVERQGERRLLRCVRPSNG